MVDPSSYTAAANFGGHARMAGYVPVFGQKKPDPAPVSAASSDQTVKTAPAADSAPPPSHGFLSLLKGLFDVINPLQHIPIVGAIYRHITGDEISPMAKIAGDTLYGGPIGGVLSMADVAVQQSTGKDMGEHVFAMLKSDKPTMVADSATSIKTADSATSIKVADSATSQTITAAPAQNIIPVSARVGNPVPPQVANIIWNDEAPASVPRAQIATKMMDALDKYQALKKSGLQPTVSAVF